MNQATSAALRDKYANALASLQLGTYKGSGDVIDWDLWDRFTLDNGTLRHTMFRNAVGSVVGGAVRTLADTNVQGANGVPEGSRLYVQALKIFYQTDEERTNAEYQDMMDVLSDTTFNFEIYGKASYGQWCLDQMMAIPMLGAVNSAAGDSKQNSSGKFAGIIPLNLPIVLASNVQFSGQIEHHAAPSADLDGDKIKIVLSGILERLS